MFFQTDAIRDYIFPVAMKTDKENGTELKGVLGTAFLIGKQGFALTARHVIHDHKSEKLIGMFVSNNEWNGFDVVEQEEHPSEDIAIIKLSNATNWKSFFLLADTTEHASCKYRLFGYPTDTTYELVSNSRVLCRPDLIYNEGYIRRRFTNYLPVSCIKGKSFFELSEVAGDGVSGAPVCKLSTPAWEVIGIYVGEKTNDRATSVSYAVRTESFLDWKPKVLKGKSVFEESKDLNT